MLHVYCGNGKGKTTAAMGLVVRALGCGMKVLLVQFLKDDSGNEIKTLSLLPGVKILHRKGKEKFTFCMTDEEKASRREEYTELLEETARRSAEGIYDMVVLDEALRAVNHGILDEAKLLEFLESVKDKLEIVVTGTHPSDKLTELADYVSEIVKRKHPYDIGTQAREGIEY
ncbi:MAG: cob(I)yrinic acid a,c-diamide adenosyltransferase [Synergistaceae bacterium]|nr:cob(I)yrinic acid a,c-diamide adenosyltransferase [Synergistaceae bacterium]